MLQIHNNLAKCKKVNLEILLHVNCESGLVCSAACSGIPGSLTYHGHALQKNPREKITLVISVISVILSSAGLAEVWRVELRFDVQQGLV